MIHDLKIWPQYYGAVLSGYKPFEVREGEFQQGDGLRLREWDPRAPHPFGYLGAYTGHTATATITYVHSGLGMLPGYVVLGLGDVREVE
jgi:hypothetical protein